jgi:hypothetical protein
MLSNALAAVSFSGRRETLIHSREYGERAVRIGVILLVRPSAQQRQ